MTIFYVTQTNWVERCDYHNVSPWLFTDRSKAWAFYLELCKEIEESDYQEIEPDYNTKSLFCDEIFHTSEYSRPGKREGDPVHRVTMTFRQMRTL